MRSRKKTIIDEPGRYLNGSKVAAVLALPGSKNELGGGLTDAMVVVVLRLSVNMPEQSKMCWPAGLGCCV